MGYLDRLAARLVEPRPLIRPRPLSRFEAADPPAAPMPEPGMAGEDDAWLATSMPRRPAPAAQDRHDDSPPLAPSMPALRAGVNASPQERRRTAVIHEIDGAPSIHEASQDVETPVLQDLRTTPGAGPAPAMAERPPADPTAMPSFRSASPPPDAAPALPVAAPQPRATAVDMADRLAPWRAPTADARPSIDPRTPAPAPVAAVAPKRREAAATAVDPSAVVQVTIGRLEVRSPETPARRPQAKPMRAAPRMSLQDYLQRRAGGHGR